MNASMLYLLCQVVGPMLNASQLCDCLSVTELAFSASVAGISISKFKFTTAQSDSRFVPIFHVIIDAK